MGTAEGKGSVMSEAKHTPLPWSSEYDETGHWRVYGGNKLVADVGDAEVSVAADNEWKANAAFIVRAVNAHEDLVRAINALLPFVDDAMDAHSVMSESAVTEACRTAVATAREALAKAEAS